MILSLLHLCCLWHRMFAPPGMPEVIRKHLRHRRFGRRPGPKTGSGCNGSCSVLAVKDSSSKGFLLDLSVMPISSLLLPSPLLSSLLSSFPRRPPLLAATSISYPSLNLFLSLPSPSFPNYLPSSPKQPSFLPSKPKTQDSPLKRTSRSKKTTPPITSA